MKPTSLLRLFVIVLSRLLMPGTRAQLVFIPDTNLWSWFNDLSPGLVDPTGHMDTLLAQSFNESFAELVVTWGPSDLTGLQYLTSLDGFDVDYMPGTQGQSHVIPAWPPNLWYLSIGGYNGDQLLPFPSGVDELHISGCSMLEQLPPLPTGVFTLSVLGMPMLGSLPPWPTTLTHLSVGAGIPQIATLPDLPSGMASMSVHDLSSLTAIPALPEGFLSLEMSSLPMLAALPDLPSSLQVLRMSTGMNVPLDTLPGGLVELQLAYQPFAGLPTIPATLEILDLIDLAQLQSLPALPSGLSDIRLQGLPQLTCLPQLPDTSWLSIWATGLTCVPNHPMMPFGCAYVSYADHWGANHLPLCTILNSTCPNNNGVITGRAYHDMDGDGAPGPGEGGWGAATVLIEPGGVLAGVDSAGYFQVAVPEGLYTLSAQANSPHAIGINPANHTADALAGNVDSLNHFGIALTPGIVDLELDMTVSWAFVPGSARSAVLTCRNTGSTEVLGSASFMVGDGAVITSTSPVPTSVNDSAAYWSLGPIPAGAVRTIHVGLLTDTTALPGMPIELVSELLPSLGDATPINNAVTLVDTVLASFDPNDKRVAPTTLTPVEVAEGKELEYTIRFQNTGTFQAERVVITDTLNSGLQWSTMRFIASSHACSWMLLGNGVLRFAFDPIVLPDSTSDGPNSHGFVKFAMKPVGDLLAGEDVGNTANIYFDFNEPVITNEAVFSVEASTAIDPSVGSTGFEMWPNPVENVLRINGAARRTIEILDLTGRVVMREQGTADLHALDTRALAPGRYTMRIVGLGARPFIKR